MHELEVEVRDADALMRLAHEARDTLDGRSQEWTPFEDTVLVLLNNVRLLIRYVPATHQQCGRSGVAAWWSA